MEISEQGLRWLKKLEGCVKVGGKHVIYNDANGRPVLDDAPLQPGATIGYGHLIKPCEDFRDGITEATATELLRRDIAVAERAVRDNITAPLSQNQYDALVALAYNIGVGAFAGSTVVRYVNNPDFISSRYPTLESAWRAWNRTQGKVSKGLIKRRDAEWRLFQNADYGADRRGSTK